VGTATTVVHHDIPQIRIREWVQIPVACVILSALAYFVLAGDAKILWHVPLGLAVRQEGAQIRINWNRAATSAGANLEIVDGAQHTSIFVPPGLGSVTYRAWTTDVEVRLGGLKDPLRTEIARCLVHDPAPVAVLDAQLAQTRAGALALRISLARNARRLRRLQRDADGLMTLIPPPRPAAVPATSTRWWRQ